MNQSIIEFENFSFQYAGSEKLALENINLSIQPGQYIAIIGSAGAGKTTLCTSINGIVPNMLSGRIFGNVRINGMNTTELPVREVAKIVGMVFDNPEYQITQMTVKEEVALGLENLGVPRSEMLERIREVLQVVGLSGIEERNPMALSGGQQQRLSIASAIVMQPNVLVLDEPTSNLDPAGKEEVFLLAQNLNRMHRITIVIAEHEVEALAKYADRIIVLDKGKIILSGSPKEIFTEVEILNSVGLRVPQVTEFFHNIQFLDDVKENEYPITVYEAESILTPILKSSRKQK